MTDLQHGAVEMEPVKLSKPLEIFRKVVLAVLAILMAGTVAFATFELAWLLLVDLTTPPLFLLEIDELLDLFGLFLLILIGLELLETITIYVKQHVIHVEIVMMVAMIAIARKVIILDVKKLPFETILGIAALVVALAAGYYVLRKARR